MPLVPLHQATRSKPSAVFNFPLAKELTAGDPLDSCQLYRLARAFNDRLPYFDFAWRITFYMLGMFRSMRNGNADGSLQAPWAEYFFSYQGLEPGQGDWPVAGPGDPEGANLSNPLNCYVWGNAGLNMDSEAVRLAEVPMADDFGQPPETVADLWDLRIRQCGAVEPSSGRQNAPAWQAARSWFGTYQGPRSPHGNSWGGFLASPAVIGQCQDPDLYDGVPAPMSYEVKFTVTAEGTAAGLSDKVYAGTCPVGPATTEDYSLHVARIVRSPWAFYVVLNSGAVDVLPRWAYVEGPYTGEGRLRKAEGGQLPRALQSFTATHRGIAQNDAGRSAVESGAATKVDQWLSGSFVAEDFLCRQYVLAPLLGTWNGSVVAPVIPSGQLTAGADSIIRAGTVLTHTVAADCTVNYGYATVSGLAAGQKAVVSFGASKVTLTPEAPAAIVPLDVAAGQAIVVTLDADVTVTTASVDTLRVELSQAVLYKPDLSDLVMVQRLIGDPDSGLDRDCSAWVGDLRARGCILNSNGNPTVIEPTAAVTEHPGFEAIRRWSRFVRLLPANAVKGYAVEDGKSIVWFARRAAWTGGQPSKTEIEMGTDGIKAGREYLVETTAGGKVYYGPPTPKEFDNGEHFVGIQGITEFAINYVGTSKVFELTDGILNPQQSGDLWSGIVEQVTATAPSEGFSNRWLCGFNFKAQHPSNSSEWKPSAYGDIFALNDRATFYAPEIVNEHDKRVLWQVAYGQGVPGPSGGNVISECPTGYRYQPLTDENRRWKWLNNPKVGDAFFPTDYERSLFFKSARIYEPEVEIESAEAVTESGVEMVKVTFKGRLHSTRGATDADGNPVGAPDEIARDVGTWDLNALQAEPYQTTERAIRCHIARTQTGRNFTATYGDHAAHSSLGYDPAYPYASDWPIVYLVKMLPEPVSDANSTQDTSDTPLWHETMIQAETYLRAMCEACVDPEMSAGNLQDAVEAAGGDWRAISRWSLHDYSYERLCSVAFDGSWPGLMPTAATSETPAEYVRPDNPFGYGPVPQTRATAQQFNRLAKMVNRLNRFRIMLPYTLETRRVVHSGQRLAPECGYACNYPGLTYGSLQGVTDYPVSGTMTDPGTWAEADAAQSDSEAVLMVVPDPGGGGGYVWAVGSYVANSEFQIILTPGIENAMPAYLRGLVAASKFSVIGWTNETKLTHTRTETTPEDPAGSRDPTDGKYYIWLPGPVNEERWFAEFKTVGTVNAPTLPVPTDMGYTYDPTGIEASMGGVFTSYSIGFIPGEIMFVEVPLVSVECPDEGGYAMQPPAQGTPFAQVNRALGTVTPSLRLAILSPCCYIGGAERWVMDLLDMLPRNIECVGVNIMYHESSSVPAIEELRKRANVYGFGVRPARDLVRRADTVISWGMQPLTEILRDYRGRRIVVIHGSDEDYSKHVVNQAVAAGAEIVCVSEACLRPCAGHPARVMRSGVDPQRVRCASGAGQVLRASLGIEQTEVVVGFVGRVAEEKRISKLLAAVPLLAPNVRVLIVGDGFDTNRLKSEAASLGKRVIFLPGRLDVAPVYDALDIFWCGSPTEGLPYTLLEAALAGVPLVTTRVGVLHEIAAQHGVLWTELPADPSPEQIAAGLRAGPVGGTALRDVVLEEYGMRAMAERWTKFLLQTPNAP